LLSSSHASVSIMTIKGNMTSYNGKEMSFKSV
jgi:hypothetical protein